MSVDPANYQAFAGALASRAQGDDLLFIRPRYDVTPVLYYLSANRYHLIGRNYPEACRRFPTARIWAVTLYYDALPFDIARALSSYQSVESVDMPYAWATLFTRTRQGADEWAFIPRSPYLDNKLQSQTDLPFAA